MKFSGKGSVQNQYFLTERCPYDSFCFFVAPMERIWISITDSPWEMLRKTVLMSRRLTLVFYIWYDKENLFHERVLWTSGKNN